ncbi:ABC transporter ATP-binding protein [Vagococcus sp.]|uniref:ABC transporter ATP-binding protein n=1 Tax=Vagococcus sp. TaxID=1933889 RepID=UPI003F9DD35C
MIVFKNVNFKYQNNFVLKNLNLVVSSGECVVITGRSGSGKTTLLRLLNGLIPELYQGEASGEMSALGIQLPTQDFNAYLEKVGVIFQNPNAQFFTTTVESELVFTLENLGFPREIILSRLDEMVEKFDLERLRHRSIFSLSGGERQRVVFAAIRMLDCELYLFDEPCSNLDELSLTRLRADLSDLKSQGKTIVIVDHRLDYLTGIADRVIQLEQGEIRQQFLFNELEKKKTVELYHYGLRRINKNEFSSMWHHYQPKQSQSLTIGAIYFQHKKNKAFSLNLPKLTFSPNEIVGIIGPNGAGKTTFSKILCGLQKVKRHQMILEDEVLTARTISKYAFLVMQDVGLQLVFETVEKELRATAKKLELYERVVDKLQLRHLLFRHPQTLSGGEKQRVVIAVAILSGKQLLIFDEPTSGLDLKNMLRLSELFCWLKTFNIFIFIVSHDLEFIEKTCQRVLSFKNGKLSSDERVDNMIN